MALQDDKFPFLQFKEQISEILRRLNVLERPTGTSVGSLVSQVQSAIVNIGVSVTAFLSAGFTSASATITGAFRAQSAPGTIITTTRVAGWWQSSDGLAGTATSSERFKTNRSLVVDDPGFDDLAVIELSIEYWQYIDEVRKRDDPTFDGYVGPDYHVAVNFSPIAERAHELGLWMIVVYERNEDGTTKYDEAGEPIPFALHDSLFAYVLQMAVQRIRREQLEDRARTDRLSARVAALDGLAEG